MAFVYGAFLLGLFIAAEARGQDAVSVSESEGRCEFDGDASACEGKIHGSVFMQKGAKRAVIAVIDLSSDADETTSISTEVGKGKGKGSEGSMGSGKGNGKPLSPSPNGDAPTPNPSPGPSPNPPRNSTPRKGRRGNRSRLTNHTGPACTKFDDCESNVLKCGSDCVVSGYRPNCKCSNGCVWGVSCTRDAVVVAQWIFDPENHCEDDGTCSDGTKKAGSDFKKRICMSYYEGKLYPENSSAGYCVGPYEKTYLDWVITVVSRSLSGMNEAYAWSMEETGFTPPSSPPARPAVTECTDFGYCYGHGRASGEYPNCKCSNCDKFTGSRCDQWKWGGPPSNPNTGTFTE